MKKTALFVFSVIATLHCFSQIDYYNRFKNIIPPAPNTASLINVTNFPKTNFTGVPDIQVPIYSIKLKDFEIPIVLRYDASGIKVRTIPSWVGTGWSLDAGGSISRSVVGAPDDQIFDDNGTNCGSVSVVSRNYGYLVGGLDSLLTFNENETNELKKSVKLGMLNGFSCQTFDNNLNVVSPTQGKRMDMNPDNFYLNILGQSYRLFFRKDPSTNQIKCLTTPYSNFKISYTIDNTLNPINSVKSRTLGITAFDVVDGSGNQYHFDKKDSIRNYTEAGADNVYERGAGGTSGSYGYYSFSSWHLTQIITSNNDTVTLTYQPESYQTELNYEYKVRGPGDNGFFSSQEIYGTQSFITGHRLTGIETKDTKVDLTAGLAREDLLNTNALTEVTITSKLTNQVQKRTKFLYDYFVSSTGSYYTSNATYYGGNLAKRLKLTSIKETSADSVLQNPYVFSYYETLSYLPPRDSRQQDFWGYYNANGANTLVPNYYLYPANAGYQKFSFYQRSQDPGTYYPIVDGAERGTNATAIVAGTLKLIQYPTGGTEEYVYEPNTFLSDNNTNLTAGGLRILRIIKDDKTSGTLTKEYDYRAAGSSNSSGHLYAYPHFAHIENTLYYLYNNSASQYNSNSQTYYQLFTFRYTNPKFTNDDGVIVGYSQVAETTNGGGRTEYRFSTPGDYTTYGDNATLGQCDSVVNGYCDNLYKVPDIKIVRDFVQCNSGSGNPPQLIGSTPNLANTGFSTTNFSTPMSGNFFPYLATTNYGWNRGLLLSETRIDNNNRKVFEKRITYTLPSGDSLFYVPGMHITYTFNDYLLDNSYPCGPGSHPPRALVYYGKYYLMANASKLVAKETTTTYALNSEATSLATEKAYDYYPENRREKTIDETTSDNQHLVRSFTYPPTTSSLGTSIKNSLLAQNIKEAVVDEEVKQGSLSIQKVSNEFDINALNNKAYLKKVTSYRNNVLARSIDVTSLDKYNNIKELFQDGVNKVILWGYNHTYPIADIENATLSDIAYTSFENAQTDNWGISPAGTYVTDNTSPTGSQHLNIGGITLLRAGLTSSKTYLVTYWYKTGASISISGGSVISSQNGPTKNGWTFAQSRITGATTVSVSGTGYIDELRLYPLGAQLKTFTYIPLSGISSVCGVDNKISYYEYDGLSRLKLIRDQDRNIVKAICYNYAGQPGSCPGFIYTNVPKSQVFQKNNCSSGYVGSNVTYSVYGGTYSSTISQQDADNQAQADVNANGQSYANQKGTCMVAGVYIKSKRENFTTSGNNTYGDVVLRLYADQACTIPVSVSNLTVNMKQTIWNEYDGSTQDSYFSVVCNGSVCTIRNQVLVSVWNSATETSTEYYFFLQTGSGYTVVSSIQWPWQN